MAFLERAALTHHLPVGTCRMGEGGDAVVGLDLEHYPTKLNHLTGMILRRG